MTAIPLSLDGKAALITGGSRGIGAETVRLFTAAGARVAFSYQKARDRAEALASECPGSVAIEQTLASASDGQALVNRAVAALGRLDILIANHGIWPPADAPISQMTDDQWRTTMAVNLDAVFGLVRAAVAQMERQGKSSDGFAGHIVMISSTAAQRGEAFHSDYAASKGALISLTKSLATELGPKGIRVNCVAPGWVATEMSASSVNDPELGPKIAAAIPIGRVGSPAEIAGPVLFLCTPLAGFISGEVLNVNGGAVLVG